jgi:DICT domain-containing protein
LTVDQVDYEAMLADPDFRVAAELHLNMVIARYSNIIASQRKIRQIRNLIDRNLDVQADSTQDSP